MNLTVASQNCLFPALQYMDLCETLEKSKDEISRSRRQRNLVKLLALRKNLAEGKLIE